jgi:hypothetical protein
MMGSLLADPRIKRRRVTVWKSGTATLRGYVLKTDQKGNKEG